MRGRPLAGFLARRLAALVALLAVLSFLVFALLHLAPGSPEQLLLGTHPRSPELVRAVRREHHLDQPFLEQYWTWLRGAAQLDFGTSIRTGQPVASDLRERAGVTLFLALYAMTLALGVGVPLGVLAALRRRSLVDRGAVGLSVVGASAPAFVTGVFLLYLFAVALGWFPSYGAGHGLLDRLWHLTLPAVALALATTALVVKLTRTALVDVLDRDHVTFARARGVPLGRVLARYALPHALVTILTAGGLVLTAVLTGTVLVETTFALPGLGALLVGAVQDKDLPVVQAVTLLVAALVVAVNLLVDLLYVVVDPRIELGRRMAA